MARSSRVTIATGLVVAIATALTAVLLIAVTASAGIPRQINYQGRLTDSATGLPLPGSHALVFRIYDSPSGGVLLWSESKAGVADSAGVFATVLGNVNSVDLTFDRSYWLEVEADGEILSPRREMVSVPYAFRAESADQASGADSLGGRPPSDFADVSHNHDGRYYTEAELNTPGTINQGTNPVDWTEIKNVPAGFADGIDNVGPGDGYSLDAADGIPTDVVYVANDGNVGVGTTTPTLGKLQVLGSGAATGVYGSSDSGTGLFGFSQNGTGVTGTSPNGRAGSFAGNVYVSGRLGIGAASPERALHVKGDNPRVLIEASSMNPELDLANSDDTGSQRWALYKDGTTDDFRFYQNGDKVTIQSGTGNVGIGTTNPTTELDVAGGMSRLRDGLIVGSADYGVEGIHIYCPESFGCPGATLRLTTDCEASGHSSIEFLDKDGDGWGILTDIFLNRTQTFGIQDFKANECRLLVDPSGNVGLGTITPERKLHIVGNGPRVLVESTAGNPEVNLKTSGDTPSEIWAMYKHSGTKDLRFYQNGDRVTFQNGTGNVGIGTTDPQGYKLYVAGAAYSTGGWSPSDARLKTDLKPIEDALSKVLQLRGISFLWRTDQYTGRGFPEGRHYGVVAQEVEQVLPEIVREGSDGEKAVAYTELIPVLIESVKELKAENEALKQRIEVLEMAAK